MSAAWRLLTGLPAWEITEIPRPEPAGGNGGSTAGNAELERHKRAKFLASACRAGTPAGFGWVRREAGGPLRVIAAGESVHAGDAGAGRAGGDVLAFPAGASGRRLPDGGLEAAFTSLKHWVPLAITPDDLLRRDFPGGGGAGSGPEVLLEEGLLGSWRGPFGWLVLAAPVEEGRHAGLLQTVSLEHLKALRHDTPQSLLAQRRSRARHEELRDAAVSGLWDIWLLAGAASPRAAARVAGLVSASLDLRGLPFGLTERKDAGELPRLLGDPAAPGAAPGKEPGPPAGQVPGSGEERRGAPRAPGWQSEPAPPPSFSPPPPWFAPSPLAPAPAPPPPEPEPPRQQYDANGFPVWTPVPAPKQEMPALGRPVQFEDPGPQFPCPASSDLLAALAVPPASEVPGVRLVLRPRFDVTPERPAGEGGTVIGLGTVLDRSRLEAGPLTVSTGSLNRHAFVCGATGAGKSQTVRHLLESASAAGIPWLVIEPAKAEYRLMSARLNAASVITIRPGDLDSVPAGINPLEPAAGPGGERFPLQAHADLVRALFLAAFRADEPFPQVLSAALTRVYTEAGWDMLTGGRADGAPPGEAGYPGLGDLQAAALKVVEEIGYARDITDNVKGFVSVRLGSLRSGTTGGFLDGGFPLDYGKVLAGNVVLEIEDCGDDADKAFLTGAILVRLTEHLRMRARAEGPVAPGLRHLTVIEEAHRLLRQPADGEGGGPAAHAVEMFAGLLAEIRAYGEGLIIAEQIPSKLIPDAIKNTAVKIVHRLPARDDRDSVGATMNLTEDQSRYLVTLRPGEAAVFTDGMDYPVLARMPDGTERETGTQIRSGKIGVLVAGRSPACPPACREAACTLGLVAAARRARERDRRIMLWAELTVLAHLTGWAAPVPRPELAGFLNGLGERVRDCALAHAAGAAVSARAAAITPRVGPGALSGHCSAAMRAALDGKPGCPPEEEWLAPVCEWSLIADVLAHTDPGRAGRHPSSPEWERAHGREIPGATIAEQLAAVKEREDRAWQDAAARDGTIFGTGETSAIETAIGSRRDAPGWRDRAAAALAGSFTGAETLLGYLAPAPVPAPVSVSGGGR